MSISTTSRLIKSSTSPFVLAVQEYTKIKPTSSRPISITISHANGVPQDAYRRFASELLQSDRVQHVLTWDVRNQGATFYENPSYKPNPNTDPIWDELASDLGSIIEETARNDMKRIGIGHSLGGYITTHTQLQNSDHFDAMVLIEPVILPDSIIESPMWKGVMKKLVSLSLRRRDVFANRQAAMDYWSARPFFQSWDPQVLQDYVDHCLIPKEDGVTLKTPKESEAAVFTAGPRGHVWERLSNIKVPTIVIGGSQSDHQLLKIPETGMQKDEAVANQVNGKATFLPAGHMVPQERAMAPQIQRLVNQLSEQL